MSTIDTLLERSQRRQITNQDLLLVSNELHKPHTNAEFYRLLLIMRNSGDPSYKRDVEPFLLTPDDMLASLALSILCLYWGYTEDYLNEIERLMRGVEWDPDDHCRSVAIAIAGVYLAEHSNVALLKQLITMFEETSDPEIRVDSYHALRGALGYDNSQAPTSSEEFDPNLIELSTIREAKQRLESEERNLPEEEK